MEFSTLTKAYIRGALAGDPVKMDWHVADGLIVLRTIGEDNLPEESYEHICEAMSWCKHKCNMRLSPKFRNPTVLPVRMSKRVAWGLHDLIDIGLSHSSNKEKVLMENAIKWIYYTIYKQYSRYELLEYRDRGKLSL